MLRILLIACVTLATAPALAVATAWQDLAPGVRARLISNDTIGAGQTIVGLELDMPQDTKTYWRIPGDSGIPTEFDFSATTGIGDPLVDWPFPEIDATDGYRDFVFHGHLVVPVRFAVAAGASAATVDAKVTLGICSDLCVPAQAHFSLPIAFGKSDPGQSLRLEMAEAQAPITWTAPHPPVGAITADVQGLRIAAIDSSIDPQSIIADVGDPATLFSAPQKSPDGSSWLLKLAGQTGGKALAGKSVQLTFMTPAGPYAVSRVVAAAP
jgi:DsbC/DsbD-like thiol-disulfide interchange protein